ncbi:MAG TPA: antibiotic biosynthesis monooxygenase [Sediminibacterium sp.]|nr:antibiotic biosynthesis monooxygenase [Sediminibacterium sp.]
MIAQTPQPPYYAVIFTSVRTEGDHGYTEMANQMVALGSTMKGFLGIESAREEIGISISYWDSLESIKAWKQQAAHQVAQEKGRSQWYAAYKTRVCLVERDYGFEQ